MKIKITLIAFLASAMMFTSCMKNESSPGIESVREAYASLLLAKAQAEVTLANAQATFINAEAAVQESIAAMNNAIAAATAATSADAAAAAAQEIAGLQALLAQQLIDWARENEAADLLAQIAMDEYEAAILAAKNDLVIEYYSYYLDALGEMRDVQTAIFTAHSNFLALAVDLVDGTSYALMDLQDELEAAIEYLAVLQAEFDNMNTIVGDVDAIDARVAELKAGNVAIDAQILALEVDLYDCEYDLEDAPAEIDDQPYLDAQAAAVYETALASFPNELNPTWWNDLQTAVEEAEQTVLDHVGDTTDASEAYYNMLADINSGTDVLDGLIVDQQELITGYNEAITEQGLIIEGLEEDTAALLQDVRDSLAAFEIADEALTTQEELVQGYYDSNDELDGFISAANDEIDALNLLIGTAETAQLGYTEGVDPEWDIYQTQIEDYEDQVEVLEGNIITWGLQKDQNDAYITIEEPKIADLQTAADDAEAQYDNAVARKDDGVTGVDALVVLMGDAEGIITDNEGWIETAEGEITDLEGQIETRLEEIEGLEVEIIELLTELRHQRTFMDEYVQDVVDAKADREARRVEYEQYMDETFVTYLAGLEQTAADLKDTYDEDYDQYLLDKAAWDDLAAPCIAIQDEIDDLGDDLEYGEGLLEIWEEIQTFGGDETEAFQTAINDQMGVIYGVDGIMDQIADAEATYADDQLDYDTYVALIASLEAELAVTQALVASTKELLDAALAAL